MAGEDVWTPAAVRAVKARACNFMRGAMVLRDREWRSGNEETTPAPPAPAPPLTATEDDAPIDPPAEPTPAQRRNRTLPATGLSSFSSTPLSGRGFTPHAATRKYQWQFCGWEGGFDYWW